MYGKLEKNGKITRSFMMLDGHVPAEVKAVQDETGGEISEASIEEFLEGYAAANNGLPVIDNSTELV